MDNSPSASDATARSSHPHALGGRTDLAWGQLVTPLHLVSRAQPTLLRRLTDEQLLSAACVSVPEFEPHSYPVISRPRPRDLQRLRSDHHHS